MEADASKVQVKGHSIQRYALCFAITPFVMTIDLALWGFIDWVFSRDADWFSDVNKARRYPNCVVFVSAL